MILIENLMIVFIVTMILGAILMFVPLSEVISVIGGISRRFSFKKIDEINNASIKTYDSESRAESSCSSWDRDFEVVEITETIEWSE